MTLTLAQMARKLLVQEAGDGESSEQVAAGAAAAWKKLFEHLSPLLGNVGVRVLFGRSLTLTGAAFPWLATAVEAAQKDAPWVGLHACLAQQHLDRAIEASVALVTTFLGLLGRFIGEALTLRLLYELWPDIAPTTQKETP